MALRSLPQIGATFSRWRITPNGASGRCSKRSATSLSSGGRRLGLAPFAALRKAHVRKLRDMKADLPEAANFRVKQISALFVWAIKSDLATANPAEKVEKLGGGSEGCYTWTDQDVETFGTFWGSARSRVLPCRSCFTWACGRSDAVLIGGRHESRDGLSVTFGQFKGRKRSAKVLTLPVLPPLRQILDASEARRRDVARNRL